MGDKQPGSTKTRAVPPQLASAGLCTSLVILCVTPVFAVLAMLGGPSRGHAFDGLGMITSVAYTLAPMSVAAWILLPPIGFLLAFLVQRRTNYCAALTGIIGNALVSATLPAFIFFATLILGP